MDIIILFVVVLIIGHGLHRLRQYYAVKDLKERCPEYKDCF